MGMPRLKLGQKAIPDDEQTTNRVIKRLAYEGFHLREDFAALKVLESVGIDRAFLIVTARGLQSDLLLRLMRVQDWEERVGSFWLLYDRGLVKAGQDRINRLKGLSKRLLSIRNGTFVHIDGQELFDPQRVYRKAKIKWRTDIEPAIEFISSVVNELYKAKIGEPRQRTMFSTTEDLEEIFSRNLRPLKKS
jgi:hypothetical protein